MVARDGADREPAFGVLAAALFISLPVATRPYSKRVEPDLVDVSPELALA
jgi:hypothetical protein